MAFAPRTRFGSAFALAITLTTARARADEAGVPDSGASADTVPVRIEAGGDYVTIGDATCERGTCIGRVPRGTLELSRKKRTSDGFVTNCSTRIVIDGPSIVRVADPGALHTAAWVALVAGVALVVVGIVVPAAVCRTSSTTDANGRILSSSNPCDDLSTPTKVAWIGGLGVGISLSLVGAVGVSLTSSPPRASVEPWVGVPSSSSSSRSVAHFAPPRVALVPLYEPRAIEGRMAQSGGISLRVEF
jgi:hypothetical protein